MTADNMRTLPGAAGPERLFFTGMAALVALVVAAGFGPSYAASLRPPGLPLWVHLHGAAMVGWIALFAVQAWLVGRGALPLHRRLGWGSIALVTLIVPLGLATTVLAVARGATPPFFTPGQMMAADAVDLTLFASLYIAALRLRRRSAWHKRLLLCATVLLTWPAFGRISPSFVHDLKQVIPAATALLLLLAMAGPIHDLISTRRVHPAYLWGVGAIILAQPLHALVAVSAPLAALAKAISG